MNKQRISLPLRILALTMAVICGGYAVWGMLGRIRCLKNHDAAGLYAFLTGDELTLRADSVSAPSSEPASETVETEEYLIFQPDEGAIPYHVVDYSEPEIEETPPADAQPLKPITVSSSMTPKNNPSLAFDADKLLASRLPFQKDTMSILIIHTHGSETYSQYKTAFWCKDMAARSEIPDETVISVGRVLKKALEEAGFRVIQDETMCDVPHYRSSYKNALAVIEKHLKADPSIGMVLDVHRDSVSASDGTRYKLLSGDGKAAQIMFVVGSNALLEHDRWQTNLAFALRLQQEAMTRYEDFVRPISISKNRYNEHMTPCSLIVECGTEANTLSEAQESARRLAIILDAVASP